MCTRYFNVCFVYVCSSLSPSLINVHCPPLSHVSGQTLRRVLPYPCAVHGFAVQYGMSLNQMHHSCIQDPTWHSQRRRKRKRSLGTCRSTLHAHISGDGMRTNKQLSSTMYTSDFLAQTSSLLSSGVTDARQPRSCG